MRLWQTYLAPVTSARSLLLSYMRIAVIASIQLENGHLCERVATEGFKLPLQELNLLAIPIPGPALAGPGAPPLMLSVPYIHQEQDNWCWAACCEMLIALLSEQPVSQCQMASTQFGLVCCSQPLNSGCDTGCWPEDAYNKFGVQVTRVDNAIGGPDIDAELNAGRAVEVYFAWTGGGAHVALITGKYPNADYEVHDPWYGQGARTLDQINSGYGMGNWQISYVSIH